MPTKEQSAPVARGADQGATFTVCLPLAEPPEDYPAKLAAGGLRMGLRIRARKSEQKFSLSSNAQASRINATS